MSTTTILTSGICFLNPTSQITDSPVSYDDSNSDDSSSSSVSSSSTISFEDLDFEVGHPLQRMVRLESVDELSSSLVSRTSSTSRSFSSESEFSVGGVDYDIDYERLVDDLLGKDPSLGSPNTIAPISIQDLPLTIFGLPKSSSTSLPLLLSLSNAPALQTDPWNPIPHIFSVVERSGSDLVFLFTQRLETYDPLKAKERVSDTIEFIRQVLEGICFLHQLSIARLGLVSPDVFMTAGGKYYLLPNLQNAIRTADPFAFHRDIIQCGEMITNLLQTLCIPLITSKFQSLITGMTSGTFSAEDSRKLFEALCRSLENGPGGVHSRSPGGARGLARSMSQPGNLDLRPQGQDLKAIVRTNSAF